eukprot:PITA_09823
MSTIIQNEPLSFTDAVKHQVWKDAMTEEYESIMKNDVWDVVPRPQEKAVVTSKWLYKIKHAVDGSAEKYKARFVARGFSQKEESVEISSWHNHSWVEIHCWRCETTWVYDADWASSVVDRKSTSGCYFSLGSASISWMSRKQKSVALSTAEAEYIAASMASCEAVWL